MKLLRYFVFQLDAGCYLDAFMTHLVVCIHIMKRYYIDKLIMQYIFGGPAIRNGCQLNNLFPGQ